jgi:hypothetical protein
MRFDRRISLAKRITSFSTLAVILSLGSKTGAGSPAQPLLSLTQWDTKSTIRSRSLKIITSIKKGETKQSLILEISLKNISHKEISFRDTYVLNDYSFVVKDRDGNVVPPSEEGRRKIFESRAVSHRNFVVLRPGEEVTRELVITDVYSFRPGKVYTITILRRISLDKGKTLEEARSNMIKAKINE